MRGSFHMITTDRRLGECCAGAGGEDLRGMEGFQTCSHINIYIYNIIVIYIYTYYMIYILYCIVLYYIMLYYIIYTYV